MKRYGGSHYRWLAPDGTAFDITKSPEVGTRTNKWAVLPWEVRRAGAQLDEFEGFNSMRQAVRALERRYASASSEPGARQTSEP